MNVLGMTKLPAQSWQHAVGDKRPATRYQIDDLTADRPLGTVESRSAPNMVKPKGLRYYTGQRGFSRSWRATCARGHNAGSFYRTRQAAIDGLVEHAGDECLLTDS